jgi:hypothetical protein
MHKSLANKGEGSPLNALCLAGGITRLKLAARAEVSLPQLAKIGADGDECWELRLIVWARVARALGCSVVDLCPQLAMRPATGLLWERGVYRRQTLAERKAEHAAQVAELSGPPRE